MKWLIISALSIGACLFLLDNLVDLFESCKDREYLWFKIAVFCFAILIGLAVFGIAIEATVLF